MTTMWTQLNRSHIIGPRLEQVIPIETIDASEFKNQCLALLDQLDADGLVVTKQGKPVARVIPYEQQWADLIASLRHKVTVKGDILGTGARWDADS